MKTTEVTLLLCAIVAFTGCSTKQLQTESKAAKPGEVTTPTSSPIIISDGSTHLRHKGSNSDFQIAPNGAGTFDQVTVNDSGHMVKAGECVKGVTTCPPAFTNNLVAPWTLDVLDSGGTKIMTISSADNVIVVANYFVGNVFTSADGSGDTNGSDIAQSDHTFSSATFTNGGGAHPVTIACTSSPCKLKINYYHN
jgi:hypothetical protein